MRKLIFALLLLPTIVFAQGTATQIRSGSTLPTACGVAFGGTLFYKTTATIGTYECSVAGNPGTWRLMYGASTGASGSDGYIQIASSGAFSSDSRIQFDVATGTFKVGNGTDAGTVELLGTAGGAGNASASSRCKISYDTTAGALIFKTSSGSSCGPSSGTFPSNTTSTSHQFFTAYNSSTGAFTKAQPAESDLSFTDITTNNASTSNHGFLKKLDNNAAHYMDGTGAWSTPASGSTVSDAVAQSYDLTPGSPNALDDEFGGVAISGSWTQVNVGGATFAEGNSLLSFLVAAHSGDSLAQIYKAVPGSTPYEFTARVFADHSNVGSNFHFIGLCLNDSSSGKITTFGPDYRGNVPTSDLSVTNWTSQTSFSAYATNSNLYPIVFQRWIYIRVKNDGTNLIFSVSSTGLTWFQITSVAKASFITTIDRVGLCVDTNDSGVETLAYFDFFRRTL
jgi:hypothetical protein